MQIAGAGQPAISSVTPYSPPTKVSSSAVAISDLESTLPPVQPLEPGASSSPSNSFPTVIYNRFAQTSSVTPQVAQPTTTGADGVSVTGQDTPVVEAVPVTPNGDGGEAVEGVIEGATRAIQAGEGAEGAPAAPSQSERSRSSAPDESAGGLSESELATISQLSQRDLEVRQHEQAHVAVGGLYAGAPQYAYSRGPDGRSYAVGGEVPIDVSSVPGNPEATIRKMEQVRRAALAPAEPSSQDRSVAARATQAILQARSELVQQQADGRAELRAEQQQEREQRQQEEESRGSSSERESEAIRTYLDLIRIGQAFEQGLQPSIQLDEVI
ncbi:putative metalloprotease CJM1_0395 family protein [Hahella aquimaris]|uniref:putative metalloprotease CJM1_0395 family protein n=1 Tax=Hahella sp. HNIBRBA332 TaxID=3015983 RepID=UPI00273B2C26|nr:putative metalloprotease CJM1_0395 family protein [Hahella sp. HNIBRBA332]WLQ14551.1 putative metalloprotease CJM1_0395 family protein [Hahella sp. HNIBRBA332]